MRTLRAITPQFILRLYHFVLAWLSAVVFAFPSRSIIVIAVTGTKGKSSVVELVCAILEKAGFKTAAASTIYFSIAGAKERNLHKMTMPGRFFLQSFLRRAVRAGCTHAVVEMTSEGVKQFRHTFIELDALIFTNLSLEHIESHGSYEKYVAAKVAIARALESSPKNDKLLVVNGDDKEAVRFREVFSGTTVVYAKHDAKNRVVSPEGISFDWKDTRIESSLPGEFNLYNILAAMSFAKAAGISPEKIRAGIETVKSIRGRAEKVEGGQPFSVIVDYAHTPDSLEKFYETYAGKYRICILGSTGGGRDKWKRPVMGAIAGKHCDEIILTNEDPYDEDPRQIIREVAAGCTHKQPVLILDRRAAIRFALQKASRGDAVLITGKGTDPCICGPHGTREPWDDVTVVRDELKKLRNVQSF